MHFLPRALSACILMTSALAYADTTPIQTAGLTITAAPPPDNVILDFSLLSQTPTSVSISFDGIAEHSRLVSDSSVEPNPRKYLGWS